jgi:serine/threonine-protein kinase RsbW
LIPATQAPKRLHLELHGDPREVMPRVEAIETFLRDVGCNPESVQQIALVTEESLANIMRDAWPGREPGFCSVDVTTTSGSDTIDVTLRTEDDGIAFDPLAADPPDLELSLDERPIGGLGILLIRTMTDRQTYRRSEGRNILEISKECRLTRSD